MTDTERAAWCALNAIFGFKPALARALAGRLGSASKVFFLDRDARETLFGREREWTGSLRPDTLERAAEELEALARKGLRFIGFAEEDYPALLRECPDAPAGLYYRGESRPAEVFARPAVAVVGTRDLSAYGRDWCGRLVQALGRTPDKPTVVSGLALGIDAAAHRSALDAGLGTVGVMATGIDAVYPWQHRSLADAIARSPGSALVTDYPPGTSPLPVHFLRRNRIIAGLAGATLLVESRIKGGGMITARQAFSYDRAVFALPGRADDARSAGCNLLIREQLAEAVTDSERFPEQLGFAAAAAADRDPESAVAAFYRSGADPRPLELFRLIRTHRGCTPDELCLLNGWDYAEVERTVRRLEADGFIRSDLLQRCVANTK